MQSTIVRLVQFARLGFPKRRYSWNPQLSARQGLLNKKKFLEPISLCTPLGSPQNDIPGTHKPLHANGSPPNDITGTHKLLHAKGSTTNDIPGTGVP